MRVFTTNSDRTSEDKHLEEPAKNDPLIHFTIMGRRTERC